MSDALKHAMREVGRLTGAGRLDEATALIQRALGTDAKSGPWGPQAAATPSSDTEAERGADPRAAERPAALGRFVSGRFTCGAGARDYRLYTPGNRPSGRPALLVMLHGCTQDPDDFAAGTHMSSLAEEAGCLVLYPAQSAVANASGCWNWYSPDHQRRGQGEPAIIAGMVREILSAEAVDERRVFVAGLSAGGAMAVTLAVTYPELFAAVGVHSGLPYGSARDMVGAMTLMSQGVGSLGWGAAAEPGPLLGSPKPVIVFQGDEDTRVHQANAARIIAQLLPEDTPGLVREPEELGTQGDVRYRLTRYRGPSGEVLGELWMLIGLGHAWSGGRAAGSFSEPRGPDASREMLRFFLSRTPVP